MAAFRYRAVNSAGRTLRGTMSAASEAELFYRLRDIGLELLDAAPVRQSRFAFYLAKPIRTRDLIELCVHLEQLERVGVPILDALGDIRESTEQIRLRDVLADLSRDVAGGKLLSEALAAHPRVFNQVFVGLVAAGERTGRLADSFAHLARHLRWADETNARVRKALRYPLFLGATTVAMLVALLVFLVPQLSAFLAMMDTELPLMTRALMAVSEWVRVWWWALLGLPVVAVVAARLAYRASDAAAYVVDFYAHRVPVVGPVMRKIALSRFAHFFAVMYQSGIGVLQCIETARRTVANRALATSLDVVRRSVEGGSSLTDAFRSSGEFPDLVVRMVGIGEESGNLEETLENITYFYDRDVRDAVDTMIGGIQPIMTAVVGLLMLWVILAVMGPVYDSFSALPL
ncbi:MAG: type II secretion system F family protein [Azospirillaceae bacterium]